MIGASLRREEEEKTTQGVKKARLGASENDQNSDDPVPK